MPADSGWAKDTYGETLVRLGQSDPRIVVVEADLMKASGSDAFMKVFPERHFNVGIAEQNLVGVAAGLAAMGKIPFASSFSSFISQRACDQDVNAVCYNRFNVKLCGTYAGLTSEKNGGTHISVEDIAIFRCMPNMVVIDPADCTELASAMEAAYRHEGPVYLRISRGPLQPVLEPGHPFKIGQSVQIQDGRDLCLVTTGVVTWQGILACRELSEKGIKIRHVHMPTIKPLDRQAIKAAATDTGRIVTAENHSRLGGLGSAVAEAVCDDCPVPVWRLGLDDQFGETATLDWLLDHFGISAHQIALKIETILGAT
jgi:transketolase